MDNATIRTRSGSETRQRLRLVQVRCTEEEHAAFSEAAERVGLSIGAYLRHQGIGKAGPRAARRPPVERSQLGELMGHLGRCGSNVNQIARVLNSGGEERPELRETIEELRAAATAIRRALGRREL